MCSESSSTEQGGCIADGNGYACSQRPVFIDIDTDSIFATLASHQNKKLSAEVSPVARTGIFDLQPASYALKMKTMLPSARYSYQRSSVTLQRRYITG